MKKVYYSLFGFITVIALIIAFENIAMSAQVLVLFETIRSLFLALLLMFFLGLVAGLFLGLAHSTGRQKKDVVDEYDL